MTARIYKPSKTAMQSGRNATVSRGNDWVLEFPRQSAARPDRLMGWQSSSDTAR
ncbi:MAG: NADH dehydrogenase ubiquinone Fe-S protein 4, partial [Candidatus Puniceispirillaceae bacterium]